MKRHLLYLLLYFSFLVSFGQTLPPKAAYPITVKQIHSGHSLTDPLFDPWPGQYRFLIYDSLGGSYDDLGKSTIPGSSINYRWENAPGFGQPDARHDIADWELLVITEGTPLFYDGGGTQSWYLEGLQAQLENLSLFVNNAWNNGNNGNGAPTLLWTTWTNVDDSNGPWRSTLDVQGLEWEKMQDYANANSPNGAPPVYLIPGHKMMAQLYDDIENDLVPGIDSIDQFFSDNIHMNDLGAYAVAMIHYACIFNQSPVGLPNVLFEDHLVSNHTPPSPELATYLQTMIWEVVTSYSRTGITEPVTSIDQPIGNSQELNFSFYPNPANTQVHIELEDQLIIQIFNSHGELLYKGDEKIISIEDYPLGIYYIQVDGITKKFVKE